MVDGAKWLGILAWAALSVSCTTTLPAVPKDYVDRNMGGYIDGKPWSYKYAYVDPSIPTPEDNDFVFIFLPFKPKKPCPRQQEIELGGIQTVMLSSPHDTTARLLKRGTSRTLVFQYDKDKKQVTQIAKNGKIKLASIGAREVRGKLLGVHSKSHWVAGNFTAEICEYADMRKDRDEDR